MDDASSRAEFNEGLSSVEARRRLAEFGANSLPTAKPPSMLEWLTELAREPVLILLLLAAAVYFVLGSMTEGAVLIVFALFSISLMVFQEQRSQKALAALRQLAAPVATVRRDGHDTRLPSAELVPGDLVVLNEGERVPADGVLVASAHLAVDESLLTGESVPVEKVDAERPRVYGGTLVVAGHGLVELTETGARTETGKLGTSLAVIVPEQTHLQRTTGRLVRAFGLLALVVCTLLAVWYGVAQGDWLRGILSGVALGMAMLPEEFPVALAIFLAIGSWRLAQVGVLVRRAAAVEALGAITCLCVDKTGTLTENRMQLRLLVADGLLDLSGTEPLSDDWKPLLRVACLASRRDSYDPMDLAVFAQGDTLLARDSLASGALVREYGITSELLALTQVWQDERGGAIVATKGAPEAVMALCRLEPAEAMSITLRVQEMADQGFRVLAVAAAGWDDDDLPESPAGFAFSLCGLLAFEDPVRPDVPAAMAEAQAAGIKVKMITGDFPATASAIARQAGIEATEVVTGDNLRELEEARMQRRAQAASVFARIRPEQKLRLVDALRAAGETVAMTGDGVNDAPALKSADVGIAMGKRGTDVAREAADIVLLNDDFGQIVGAVRLGRRIFDNLRKVIIYIAAVHVPIAGLGFLPIVFGLPAAIWPLHVVIMEMVVDSMCSLAFEDTPAEPDVMRRPPRSRGTSVAGLPQILLGLAQGSVVLAGAFGIYAMSLAGGTDEDVARTMALLVAILGDLALVLSNASQQSVFHHWRLPAPQPLFAPIAGVTVGLLALAIAVPALRDIFQFGAPSLEQFALVAIVVIVAFVLLELLKLLPAVGRITGAIHA
jgi:Ca2+-transporting ATPase